MKIRAVGIDAAFANMGFAVVDIEGDDIRCLHLELVSTEKDKAKTVRVSSDRLRRSQELREAFLRIIAASGAQFAFVEVPSGTQNAQAAFGLGIAIGVLASCPVPIIEVSPMEVKAAVAGKRVQKGATKAEIIAWAEERWPHAPWLRALHKSKTKAGIVRPAGRLTDDNEHLADALASVKAGINTPEYKRLMALYNHATPGPHLQRSAPRRRALLLLPVGTVPVARERSQGGARQDDPDSRRRHRRQG